MITEPYPLGHSDCLRSALGQRFFASEFTCIRYRAGTAGIASSGKDTEGVQYFITHSMQPHPDGRYAAFGRVIYGQDVVDVIQQGDVVVRAVVERNE